MAEVLKITVITPVYNREDCIGRCIESVQNQKFENYEHIIVDDGSSDSTIDNIKSYCKFDEKIKLIKLPENLVPIMLICAA